MFTIFWYNFLNLYIFRYYRTLEFANKGDIRPFLRFIAECTEKTLNQFLLSTTTEFSTDIPGLDYDNIIINES